MSSPTDRIPITRNPLYLFSAVAAVGVGAQIGLAHRGRAASASLCAAAFHVVILREERYPDRESRRALQSLSRQVPRFFPEPSLYREGEAVGFRPSFLLVTMLDGLVFLVAMPLFEIIDAAQLSGTLPVLFRIP